MSSIPVPLAGVKDQEVRFAIEKLAQHSASDADLWLNGRTHFGMVGDNSTDNLTMLNNAIATLNVNGGALYIPPGIYQLSDVPDAITGTDILIFGAGPATRLKFATSAAHGTFFTVGSHATAAARVMIKDFVLQCNDSSNTPPASERAFHLVNGGTMYVQNIICVDIGGLCKIGTTDTADRVQLYGFENVRGNWNSVTSAPSRIHILNGTNGRYTNVRLTANEVNGGKGIHADPTSLGVDQHFFTNCEVWSEGAYSENIGHGTTYDGIDWNVYLDFTTGQIYNWVFSQCVFDEGRLGAVRFISSGGSKVCKEVHFLDCHFETNAGNGVLVSHTGSATMTDCGLIAGRIRHKDAPAIKLTGSNLDSFIINGTSFLQEQVGATGSNATRDSIQHTFKHGRAVDDAVVFSGTVPNPLVAGTTYYVKNADANSDGLEFTVSATTPAGAGATINITNNVSSQYRVKVASAVQITDALAVRVTGAYFGPFEGGTTTKVNYACEGTGGAETGYAIVGNVARGMVTGFSNGLAHAPPATVVISNVNF